MDTCGINPSWYLSYCGVAEVGDVSASTQAGELAEMLQKLGIEPMKLGSYQKNHSVPSSLAVSPEICIVIAPKWCRNEEGHFSSRTQNETFE